MNIRAQTKRTVMATDNAPRNRKPIDHEPACHIESAQSPRMSPPAVPTFHRAVSPHFTHQRDGGVSCSTVDCSASRRKIAPGWMSRIFNRGHKVNSRVDNSPSSAPFIKGQIEDQDNSKET